MPCFSKPRSHVEVPEQRLPAIISDPDDDPILQTAILGHADVLCTRDGAFEDAAVHDYCRKHGVRILGDVVLMHELRRLSDA